MKIFTLSELLNHSFQQFADHPAVGRVGEKPLTYKELYEKVRLSSDFYRSLGIKKDDKVALLATNSPEWVIQYFGITRIGAVIVPLLPDFSPIEIRNILEHSEARILLVSDDLRKKIDFELPDTLQCVIRVEDSSVIEEFGQPDRSSFQASDDNEIEIHENDLATIIYTSGTTGKSKGVMLSHKNICHNAYAGTKLHKLNPGDRSLSILPLSHTFECTVGMVLPLLNGSWITYLGKAPSPTVLQAALQEVKPTFMLSVPLVIEKIYKSKIIKGIEANKLSKALYKTNFGRTALNRIAGKKLMKSFGGCIRFFGIGGAKLDTKVEQFLSEAKFPYSIGYGLTETAPLLAGAVPGKTVLGSTGVSCVGVDLKINNPDPKTGEGEIWAKGPNVMMGYYKDEETTKAVLTEDGWFKTGDMGTFDSQDRLFIKSRLKNMIVGASGENIYPEDIETVINNFKNVVESLVIQKKGKLVAYVHFNKEELESRYKELKEDVHQFVESKIDEMAKELDTYLKMQLNRFSQVQQIYIQRHPFEKTATHKIKRYLYV